MVRPTTSRREFMRRLLGAPLAVVGAVAAVSAPSSSWKNAPAGDPDLRRLRKAWNRMIFVPPEEGDFPCALIRPQREFARALPNAEPQSLDRNLLMLHRMIDRRKSIIRSTARW